MAHYIAVIDVYHVEAENPSGNRGMSEGKVEITKVILRARTLEGLKQRIKGHVELMESLDEL